MRKRNFLVQIAIIFICVIFITFDMVFAQSSRNSYQRFSQENRMKRPGVLSQQSLVDEFLKRKERVQRLVEKQNRYKKMLSDISYDQTELDKIVEKEKRRIIIEQIEEINKKLHLADKQVKVSQ